MTRPDPARRLLLIHQVQTISEFRQFEAGIRRLLFLYQSILLDDFSDQNPERMVANTATYLPWLWLLVDDIDRVYGLVCLTDIIPGRHAYLHGLSDPSIRRHPAISDVSRRAITLAFDRLQVRKIKIEIEAGNKGAKGFCLRMGFRREACFKRDNCVGGQWQDVLVYSLFREYFEHRML